MKISFIAIFKSDIENLSKNLNVALNNLNFVVVAYFIYQINEVFPEYYVDKIKILLQISTN
jgi:hypothetical protein